MKKAIEVQKKNNEAPRPEAKLDPQKIVCRVKGRLSLPRNSFCRFLSPPLKQNGALLPYKEYEKNSYISPGGVV